MFRAVANEETDSKNDSRKLLLATTGLVRVRAGKSGKYLVVQNILSHIKSVFYFPFLRFVFPRIRLLQCPIKQELKVRVLEYQMTYLLTTFPCIAANEKCLKYFSKCRDDKKIRFIKISIENDGEWKIISCSSP